MATVLFSNSCLDSHILVKFHRASPGVYDYDSDSVNDHATYYSSHIEEAIGIIKTKWSELGKERCKNEMSLNQFEDTVNAGVVMFSAWCNVNA